MSSPDPLLGREIAGKYRIEAKLGEGGMGVVYRARHLLLGTEIALKTIRPELAATRQGRERFLREARAATALTSPRIVAVREVGEDGGRLFLTMDLVQGRTLKEVLSGEGPLPAARAVAIADALLEALEAAHAAGFLHRDLKPANVVLEPDDSVKVLDLGLAKWIAPAPATDESLTAEGVAVGTLRYMSPEQVAGDAVDARSDLYSASAVLYEMLSGRPPHEAPTRVQLARKILCEEAPTLPGPLGAFLARGLARRPEERPASATEARGDLARAAGPPAPERPVERARRRLRRPVVLASAAGLIALAIGLAIRTFPDRPDEDRREALLAEARARALAGRWEDSASAYEEALAIHESAEARLGLETARVEIAKAAARTAESEGRWEDAVRRWRQARAAGGGGGRFEDEIRTAGFEAAILALREALERGDLEAAARGLEAARALASGPRSADVLRELERDVAGRRAREETLAAAALAARDRSEPIVERSAWRAYLESIPDGPRSGFARERIAGIERAFREGRGLVVDSDPRGADVTILDGEWKGTTPLWLEDLPAGKHRLVLTKDLHHPCMRTVEVPARGAAEVLATLRSTTGNLEVRTGVAGAAVVLAGEGAPRQARADGYGLAWFAGVPVGRSSLEVRAPDGAVVSGTVEVQVGALAVADLRDRWRPGSLHVETEPPALEVSIGRDAPAPSPIARSGLPPGWVEVVVEEPGGRQRLAVARIRPGATTRVRIDLADLSATEERASRELARAISKTAPPEALAACDAFLARHPGARSTPEVLVARRVFEILTGDVAPSPSHEVDVPASFRTARALINENGAFLVRPAGSGAVLEALALVSGQEFARLSTDRSGAGPARTWFAPGGVHLCAEWRDEDGRPARYEIADLLREEWVVAIEVPPDGDAAREFFWHHETSSLLVGRGDRLERYDLSSGEDTWNLEGVRLVHEAGGSLPTMPIVDVDGDGEGDRALDPRTGRTQPFFQDDVRTIGCVVDGDRALVLAEDSSARWIFVLDLARAAQLGAISIPELIEDGDRLALSADGGSIWTVHRSPGGLRWTPLTGSPIWFELDHDRQRVEFAPGGRYGLVLTRPAGAGRSGPLERVTAYDLDSGELALEIAAGDLPPGLDPDGLRPVRGYDALHVVLTDGVRAVVVERATGRIRLDREIGREEQMNWVSPLDRGLLRGPLEDHVFRPGDASPIWSGPPVAAFDVERRLAMVGRSDSRSAFSFADPPRTSWIDVTSGAALLVDAAFARRYGRTRPIGVGPYWIVLGDDDRLRLFDEVDLLHALLPHPSRLPFEPGALLEIAREAVESRAR